MDTYNSQVFPSGQLALGLNIGCGGGGTCFREPYINLDLNYAKHAEGWEKKRVSHMPPIYFIIADAQRLPFNDESFDEVYASHILEHFNMNFTRRILLEWYRVLKRGGRIKVCVPNFQFAVDTYRGDAEYKDWETGGLVARKGGRIHGLFGPSFQIMYGWSPIENSQYVGHKMVFDAELLQWFMEQAGLRDVQRAKIHSCPYQDMNPSDLCMIGIK